MLPLADHGYRIELTGIGGDGIVSTNSTLANAASADGLWVATSDETGLAQKSGSVVSHLWLGSHPLPGALRANRGAVDLLIAYDLVTAERRDVMDSLRLAKSKVVLNTNIVLPAEHVRGGAWETPALTKSLVDRLGGAKLGNILALDATRIAEALFEDHFAVNSFLIGIAFQAGWIPISVKSMRVGMRLSDWVAFSWGRKYFLEPELVENLVHHDRPVKIAIEPTMALRKYQNEKWAREYEAFVGSVKEPLKPVVGANLLKLMTYKDEYEVARLLSLPEFYEELRREWRGIKGVHFYLHPPVLRALGFTRKIRLCAGASLFLQILARLRFLRGTLLDPFGHTKVRRAERKLIHWYRNLVHRVEEELVDENLSIALEILDLPMQVRGYEHIKAASIHRVQSLAEEKLRAMSRNNTKAFTELEDERSMSVSI